MAQVTDNNKPNKPEDIAIPEPVKIPSISILNSSICFGSKEHSINNTDEFKKFNFGAVINCQDEFTYPVGAIYDLYNFDFEDTVQGGSLMEHIDEVMKTIDNVLRQKKLMYIQCNSGDSVSPAILIYLLMVKKDMSFERAYKNVKRVRPTIDINPYILAELRTFDEWCRY